jgi:hypothetical protein
MTWDEARVSALAEACRQQYVLSQGDHVGRAEVEQPWWAWEAVDDGVREGTLPVEVLDALLHHDGADEGFRGSVAAGPIEGALAHQAGVYAAAIAERCAADPVWAEAAAGVWLTDVERAALPSELQQYIPVPPTDSAAEVVTAKPPERPST